MSKRFLASVLGLLALMLAVGVATAAADAPPGVQTADQSAGSGQLGAAASGATQTQPSNTNISVRVLSPGNGGNVTQTNSVSSTGKASNDNTTTQNASQTLGGAGGIQTSNQSAGNAQLAAALSQAAQYAPSNTNLSVRVGSDGNDGSVTQANTASSDAKAKNDNDTTQTSDQSQVGGTPCGCATTPIQTSDQSAQSAQKAIALSAAEQKGASNVNLPIRVGSSGSGGSVSQTNDVSSDAKAKNDNDLDQSSKQDASGGTGTGVQTAAQSATNYQGAAAASSAKQDKPSNVNISVRVLSPGDDGSVTQSNTVSSSAKAKNDNDTTQTVDQHSSSKPSPCGCDGTGIQTATQGADSKQGALALSKAEQKGASNVNAPIRVGSSGNDGSVRQSNDVFSEAKAKNDNDLHQSADQDSSGPSGTGVQTADQWAGNAQFAAAASAAEQKGASNKNAPIRVGSSGNGGSVSQSNDVFSEAKAKNDNDATQTIHQDPSGSRKDKKDCGCDSKEIQTAKQGADNKQAALALSKADQDFGHSKCGCDSGGNSNAPIRVGSYGNDGDVWQSNDVSSKAKAKNDNDLHQSIDQDLSSGAPGTGVQTGDQWAGNAQLAAAASFGVQKGASNKNAPIRVKSSGDGGRVGQSNDVSSAAKSKNDNDTTQTIHQDPSGRKDCGCDSYKDGRKDGSYGDSRQGKDCGCDPYKDGRKDGSYGDSRQGKDCGCDPYQDSRKEKDCGCDGKGIQTAKQGAENKQAAFALSGAAQLGASNKNAPIRVGSSGNDGSVYQSNDVSSKAKAKNDNDLDQSIDQDLSGGSGSTGVQTADQYASNAQFGAAGSFAVQLGAKNENAPLRVKSDGNGGNVTQSNDVSSKAKAKNDNDTHQTAHQDLSGHGKCGCETIGVQALGQKAVNWQGGLALSKAVQDFGRSECGCHSAGNSNDPVRVKSSGDDGSVRQDNTVSSDAKAKNHNDLDQYGRQTLTGGSKIGIQALGQEAWSKQGALALSAALQFGARNHNAPVRVKSSGNEGSVAQSNDASSDARARNKNRTGQDGRQDQSGHDCGCTAPIAVQALGQSAKGGQDALGLSGGAQPTPRMADGGGYQPDGGYQSDRGGYQPDGSGYQPVGGGAEWLGQLNDGSPEADTLNRDRGDLLARHDRS